MKHYAVYPCKHVTLNTFVNVATSQSFYQRKRFVAEKMFKQRKHHILIISFVTLCKSGSIEQGSVFGGEG